MPSLRVAISSCPNDTFAFYHFLHDPLPGFDFVTDFLDIQNLNQAALAENPLYDIIKVSFMIAPRLAAYELMQAGSAIGFGVGPILLARQPDCLSQGRPLRLALPGKDTSAHLLWDFYARQEALAGRKLPVIDKQFMVFSDIMPALEKGEADLGLVIHEGRFVYRQHGLSLVQDLGQYWEQVTGFPVPLGGIFIRRSLPAETKELLNRHLQQSVEKALQEKHAADPLFQQKMLPFIKLHSAELEPEVLDQHIETYVNAESCRLGQDSRKAIEFFTSLAAKLQ